MMNLDELTFASGKETNMQRPSAFSATTVSRENGFAANVSANANRGGRESGGIV